jgi:hypothetical protein
MTTLFWRYGYSALRRGGYHGARARRFWLNVTLVFLVGLLVLLRVWPSLRATVANASSRTLTFQAIPHYPNCAAAHAAGPAPIHSGEPSHRPDANNDGTACTRYPK